MTLILDIILLIAGFWLLIEGADKFVEGASSVAGNYHISKILIGLTIVAFGTSAPEFAVSISSKLAGSGSIVLGNVIGSNILNILLILGASALIHSLQVKNNTRKRELPLMLLLTALLSVLIADHLFDSTATNVLSRADGIVILLFFAVFLYYLVDMARKQKDDPNDKTTYLPVGKAWIYTLGGIVAIILGSELAVHCAQNIALFFGVSDKLIGLTVVALGTSLPELITSLTATRKGEYDLAIGNVIGSNLFNIGIVLGLPVALLGSVEAVGFEWYDIAVLLLSAALLFVFAANDRKISRKEGLVFLILFVVYYSYVIYTGVTG